MDHLGPFSFNGIRMLMAGFLLLPVIFMNDRLHVPFSDAPSPSQPASGANRSPWLQVCLPGLLCGILLFVSSTLQQIGLVYTTAGKAGFITALYVVLVPVASWLLFRKNPGRWIWISILLAVAGLFLLCVPGGESFSLASGDLLLLGCAVCFTGQILSVDRFSPRVSPVRLSRDMFLICGSMGLLLSLFTETITWSGIRGALPALLYAGILSGALAYTLQILGQRDVHHPAISSLIMCLESVFSVLGGALVLGERLSSREGIGCVIMFAAVVLAQISPLLRRRR
jgi:drug/metabolite transporter (DMT)-like permease